ncbi:MAG: tRNA pseudouridine(38-40) synthase TruA [Campylobacter sp.]
MKIKLIYSYDGSKFCGSQTQPNCKGVEDRLKFALSKLGISSNLLTSSRTDKGVHALNQVSSIECAQNFSDLNKIKNLINRHANPFIHVKFIERISKNFHPRYDAKFRSYRYIVNHGEFSPFLADYETFLPKFDIKKANEILSLFVGKHDFIAFMKLGSDVKSTTRSVKKAFCYQRGNRTVFFFKANGFLRSQIRLMVACVLKAVALENGKELVLATLGENLSLKNANLGEFKNGVNLPQNGKNSPMTRKLADAFALTRMPAPASGLYLHRVFY